MPTPTPDLYTLRGTADVLLQLVIHFPELPTPHISVDRTTGQLNLTCDTVAEFELWREALSIDADSVTFHPSLAESWLSADGVARTRGKWEVPVHLTGWGIVAEAVQPAEHLAAVA